MRRFHYLLGAAFICLLPAFAGADLGPADELPQIQLKDGHFEPLELVVPASAPFKIRVSNQSSEAIEFESFELHRERVVPPGQTIEVSFPSLDPGSYQFFDDFHDSVPHGAIVVK